MLYEAHGAGKPGFSAPFPIQHFYILLWSYEASRLWHGKFRATMSSSETADMAQVLAIKICGCAGKAGTNVMSAAAMAIY